MPDPARGALRRCETGVFVVTFLIGLGYAAIYEIYEAGADALLGSRLQDSLADTNTDLLFGALGSAVGAWVLVIWTRRGWAVMRRMPADALIAFFGRAGVTRHVAREARSRRD